MLRHYYARFQTLQPGFTLLELTIVTVIIGTLATLVAPSLQGVRERAQAAAATTDIRIMESELTVYIFENREPPVSLAVIGRATLLDPWGIPYVYNPLDGEKRGPEGNARKDMFLVPLNSDYDLYSMGADGESSASLAPPVSHDDILRALDGAFVGLASTF